MNTKLLAVAMALVMVVAFSGCIESDQKAYMENGDINTPSENTPESPDTVDPQIIEQINSELISEEDSVEIGEMI